MITKQAHPPDVKRKRNTKVDKEEITSKSPYREIGDVE
jgi:hypothetical protein